MLNVQFDIKRIKVLKELLVRLRNGESAESMQAIFEQHFQNFSVVGLMLLKLELINGDYGVTIEDMKKFSAFRTRLYGNSMKDNAMTYDPNHPIQIFKEENAAFQIVLSQLNELLASFEADPIQFQNPKQVDEVKDLIFQLGEFHNHYHRKEKLFFPIMERYGFYAPTRTVWGADDRIRGLYQALKIQIVQYPDIELTRLRKRYDAFAKEFKAMIFQEEAIILPILQSILSEENWIAIANESDAFGYALIEAPDDKWVPKSNADDADEGISKSPKSENLVYGGGGFLTTEEAQLVLNNLPLEITFVDKHAMFKYFNEITEASDMMLVRTPSSIGRNVANCHPPKSLMKVMTLIRDLKSGRRTIESMWFKKNDQYIHITYKSIFNEEGEFLGVLEYVQDIQPFLQLPSEIKMGLTELDH